MARCTPARSRPRDGQRDLGAGATAGVGGQEDHGHGVLARGGEVEPRVGGHVAEERVRQLKEQPGAVARALVSPGGPTVREALEDLEAVPHQGVGGSSRQVGDEPDTAGVGLVARVGQASLERRSRAVRIVDDSDGINDRKR